MPKYTAKIYKGDYIERQRQANTDGAICYFEQHFNSGAYSRSDGYSMAVVGNNASERSKQWGSDYAVAVEKEFAYKVYVGEEKTGINIGGFGGRGNINLKYTVMPAILGEPFFIDNPRFAQLATQAHVQSKLAQILVESIKQNFPQGGLVAFSIGHKYKTSDPDDRGAKSYHGDWEADLAEKVIEYAVNILNSTNSQIPPEPQEQEDDRDILIQYAEHDHMIVLTYEESVEWNGERKILTIR